MLKQILKATDGSINYILARATKYDKNIIECRYVRREPHYISTYLSSHNGCKMGCTFCWLTQSNQTNFDHVNIFEYANQLDTVLSNVPEKDINLMNSKDVRVNINFMARGEAMANKFMINKYQQVYDSLQRVIQKHNYGKMKMNISSIYPHTLKNYKLEDIFKDRPVNFYYSIYSQNDDFRKKFMPNAMPVKCALDGLKSLQDNHPDNTIVFHCSFIKGENDDVNDVIKMADLIKDYNFKKTKFNLVRLNPYIRDGKPIMEEANPDKLKEIFNIMNDAVTNKVETQKSRIIKRVGSDAFVSCGMFANSDVDMEIYNRSINE